MGLWLLKFHTPCPGGYDTTRGMVVRAHSEEAARATANRVAEGEHFGNKPWLDPNLTYCTPLTADGESGLILRDFLHG
jgi:hypothetical protein